MIWPVEARFLYDSKKCTDFILTHDGRRLLVECKKETEIGDSHVS